MTIAQLCTNDNDIPPSWEQPPMRDNFLFDSWFTCCEVMFMGSQESHDCGMEDVCGGDEEETVDEDGCEGRLWHPDNTASLPTCTNTLDGYPSYWENPEMKGLFMFDKPDECCDMLKGQGGGAVDNDCSIKEANDCVDGGNPNGQDSSSGADHHVGGIDMSCDNRKWHVSKSKAETCTNDDDFPSSWNDDSFLGKTMFSSHNECCNSLEAAFGLSNSNCNLVNVCTDPLYTSGSSNGGAASSSCSYPWHPTSDFNG
eukprot:CAMPEP_0201918322 /NCGR_PEP_ID=MMETSP0903-20130614/7517_1 /ASSEMBLY_ACC=CAM_ASM_000552 /TAXON_ID=420261 /ORGANISM="Thalassiosira antarctica, Strain CCMP982" /LENGTH=255 /DNA_ID=CAMNT_0048454617 /DNA_START=281 /DNA_END=1044 /DNA_ORIENTATION=+